MNPQPSNDIIPEALELDSLSRELTVCSRALEPLIAREKQLAALGCNLPREGPLPPQRTVRMTTAGSIPGWAVPAGLPLGALAWFG